MKKTELAAVLTVLELVSGCKQSHEAQTLLAVEPKATRPVVPPPPPLPPLPKPPPVVGRPSSMPCWLVVKHALPDGEYDSRGTIYELSYGPGGRLESATQWPFKSYCVGEGEDNCVELHGEPAPRLLYQYDPTTGRLSGVTATLEGGRTGQMILTYGTSGQLERYEWTEQLPGGRTWRTETTLAFDGAGHPTARLSKGRSIFKKKVLHALELSRLEGTGGTFSPRNPVIWPDSPSEVFVGWTSRETLGRIEGADTRDEEEYVRVGDNGRVGNSTYQSRGKSDHIRVFAYDCPKEGDFRRIAWKSWSPSDAPELLRPRGVGLQAKRTEIFDR